MTRHILVRAALASVLTVLSAASFAMASPAGPQRVAITQGQSDSNMRWAFNHIERNIDFLQNDWHDYGGYRVKAISLFQQARQQILLGLRFDNGRGDVPPAAGFMRPDKDMNTLRPECASNANLNLVRRNIEHIIDVLQRDLGDYGSHRVKAISLLQQGRESLKDAIQFDDTH